MKRSGRSAANFLKIKTGSSVETGRRIAHTLRDAVSLAEHENNEH
jgi:hypothetical protein